MHRTPGPRPTGCSAGASTKDGRERWRGPAGGEQRRRRQRPPSPPSHYILWLAARAHRYDHPLALLVLDFDELKALNDKHGHAAGDEALRHVAVTLRRVKRGGDHAFRIGGDEFAVLLPESTAADARAVAERISQELRSLPAADDWKLSMSFGVSVHDGGDDPAALLRSADGAMYEMKRKREALGALEDADADLDAVA